QFRKLLLYPAELRGRRLISITWRPAWDHQIVLDTNETPTRVAETCFLYHAALECASPREACPSPADGAVRPAATLGSAGRGANWFHVFADRAGAVERGGVDSRGGASQPSGGRSSGASASALSGVGDGAPRRDIR